MVALELQTVTAKDHLLAEVANHPFFRRRQLELERSDRGFVLHGAVMSFYEKQLAQEIVRRADGAAVIENEIEVSY